jgi:hypothetical protein
MALAVKHVLLPNTLVVLLAAGICLITWLLAWCSSNAGREAGGRNSSNSSSNSSS